MLGFDDVIDVCEDDLVSATPICTHDPRHSVLTFM